jgi:hypothetical protein
MKTRKTHLVVFSLAGMAVACMLGLAGFYFGRISTLDSRIAEGIEKSSGLGLDPLYREVSAFDPPGDVLNALWTLGAVKGADSKVSAVSTAALLRIADGSYSVERGATYSTKDWRDAVAELFDIKQSQSDGLDARQLEMMKALGEAIGRSPK